MHSINFFREDVAFELIDESSTAQWIKKVIEGEGYSLQELNFIFCSDEYLLNINMAYLNHDTYTDIITFDNSDEIKQVEGDIYISIDRIKDNAQEMNLSVKDEIDRVMIHGVLHLMGLKDKTTDQQKEMRDKEDTCLSLRP